MQECVRLQKTLTKALQRRYNKLPKFRGRNETYEIERTGVQQKTSQLFGRYDSSDFGYKQWLQQKSRIQNDGHNDRLGTERRGGSRETRGAFEGQSQVEAANGNIGVMPIVEEFTDISSRKREILRVNGEYMVYDTHLTKKYFSTPQEAIKAENNNITKRYAYKYERPLSWVKEKLASDPDFLKKERLSGKRYALSRESTSFTTGAKQEPVDVKVNVDALDKRGKLKAPPIVVNLEEKSKAPKMPDGSAFKFSEKKNTDQEAQRGVPKGSLANATRSVSKNSIHNSSQKVNNKNKKAAEDLHFPANPRHPYR